MGKLFIAGGGWSFTNRLHGYVAVLLQIPWDYVQRHVKGGVSLTDEHGAAVLNSDGQPIVQVLFDLEVAPGVNAVRGEALDGPLAIPLPAVDVPHGRYKLLFEVEGESNPDWELPVPSYRC